MPNTQRLPGACQLKPAWKPPSGPIALCEPTKPFCPNVDPDALLNVPNGQTGNTSLNSSPSSTSDVSVRSGLWQILPKPLAKSLRSSQASRAQPPPKCAPT